MKISTILENIHALSNEELLQKLSLCQQALQTTRAAAAALNSTQRARFNLPRARALESAIRQLKQELESRQ